MSVVAARLRPNQILSEIIASEKVGGLHLRRVGELLVAREQMNSWLQEYGNRGLSAGEFADIAERVLELEDGYAQAWRKCEAGDQRWRHAEGLVELELALKRAVDYFREVGSVA
ncbi:hypothetical protein ABZW02_26505 [Streptomyces sp. NPDC005180]|uniref:hypothetical protein n=1 Tax=Streptomyces sp. NPDC005180 TaxID=3156868 RepID=UPI0033B3BBA6